jgi:hypothetical protein
VAEQIYLFPPVGNIRFSQNPSEDEDNETVRARSNPSQYLAGAMHQSLAREYTRPVRERDDRVVFGTACGHR